MRLWNAHLATQTRRSDPLQLAPLVLCKTDPIADLVQFGDRYGAGPLETIGDPDRVDATVEEGFGLFEKGPG